MSTFRFVWYPPAVLFYSLASLQLFLKIQDRKLLEEPYFYSKPNMRMAEITNLRIADEEDEENWENDLVEHSYNPLEVKQGRSI